MATTRTCASGFSRASAAAIADTRAETERAIRATEREIVRIEAARDEELRRREADLAYRRAWLATLRARLSERELAAERAAV